MRPYEWMVKNTAQKEWIDGRGILLWLAFFLGGVGGGLYLVSLWFDSLWGLLLGWLIIAIGKTGTHLAYLGHPERFWRGFLRPKSSWVSRGLIFIILFAIFGGVHLVLAFGWPRTEAIILFKILAGITAFLVVINSAL